MKTIVTIFGLLCILASMASAAEADRFVRKLTLPSGQVLVVAEGDFEPRSIGSFSVRLYAGTNPRFPADDFLSGIIHGRDGSIEKTLLADVDGDGRDELIVLVQSAGTGGFLSAHAFSLEKKSLALRASVVNLAAGADPMAALRKAAVKSK